MLRLGWSLLLAVSLGACSNAWYDEEGYDVIDIDGETEIYVPKDDPPDADARKPARSPSAPVRRAAPLPARRASGVPPLPPPPPPPPPPPLPRPER